MFREPVEDDVESSSTGFILDHDEVLPVARHS
jgi:hypothetical protein